jgi:hypothetical protein
MFTIDRQMAAAEDTRTALSVIVPKDYSALTLDTLDTLTL